MTEFQKNVLEPIARRTSVPKNIARRVAIILRFARDKTPKKQIARELDINVCTVKKWTARWAIRAAELATAEASLDQAEKQSAVIRQYEERLFDTLKDAPRSGARQLFPLRN